MLGPCQGKYCCLLLVITHNGSWTITFAKWLSDNGNKSKEQEVQHFCKPLSNSKQVCGWSLISSLVVTLIPFFYVYVPYLSHALINLQSESPTSVSECHFSCRWTTILLPLVLSASLCSTFPIDFDSWGAAKERFKEVLSREGQAGQNTDQGSSYSAHFCPWRRVKEND